MYEYAKPSWALALEQINQDNGTRLTNNDVHLENIRPLIGYDDWRNTIADVVANECGQYKDNFVIRYRRIDIGLLFSKVAVEIPFTGGDNTHTLLPYLNKWFLLALEPDDIEKDFFNSDDLPVTVKIRIKEGNPAWIGELPLTMVYNAPLLRDHLPIVDLKIHDYPTKHVNMSQGHLFLADKDYSSVGLELMALGDISGTNLKPHFEDPVFLDDVVNTASPVLWTATLHEGTQNYSLTVKYRQDDGTVVPKVGIVYNGPITPLWTKRTDFERICVIRIPPSSCRNVLGNLILFYNTP